MFSNRYIILYSAAMVTLVAIALTLVSVQLKPFQESNVRVEKIQNILASVNVSSTKKDAEELYSKYVKKILVVNTNGEIIEGVDGFKIDLAVELKKNYKDRLLPVFVCNPDSGIQYYSVPVRGKGLWGPIWGYVSFKDDFNTIAGSVFDHKGETPGLGAEINTVWFQSQFKNKTIFDDSGKLISVKTKKGASDDNPHEVDAISGGTITSNGLNDMLYDCLKMYENYFKKSKK